MHLVICKVKINKNTRMEKKIEGAEKWKYPKFNLNTVPE